MVETIAIGQADDDTLTVTMRGTAENIIAVLVNGLPREALVQLNDAITSELDARRTVAASKREPLTR